MKKFILTLSIVLAGCGGGGGSTPTPAPQPVEQSLFQAPVELPDLKNVYNRLCEYNTNLQNIYLADLNKDGKKDLVLTLWCSQVHGVVYDGPVVNGVIVLTQNSDGTFTDSTKKMFNVDFINLNGVVVNGVVHDFNNDGYEDIVFTVNREDGRLPSIYPMVNHNDYNAFITSDGSGGYHVIRQGQFAANYGITLIDNDSGGKDIISIPIGYDWIIEVWNYISGWKLDTSYQWIRGSNPLITKNKAVVEQEHPYIGLRLFTKSNNSWSQIDSYSFGNFVQVPWLSWQKSLGTNNLITIDGKDYVGTNLENKCNLKINPTDTDYTSIIALNANEIIGGYKGGTIIESSNNLATKSKLLAFETKNNKINKISIKINNFVEDTIVYHLICKDLNGDGYDDIMIQDWRANTYPMIYLNDKLGQFDRVSTSKFPGLNQYTRGQSYIYEDINGDGIKDLLHFPIVGLNNTVFNSVKLMLYKGNRHLESKDLMPKT